MALLNGYNHRRDLIAALAVTALAIPQGVAYAVIAGLPPAAGLYAAALPLVIGSLARSSQHVIAGPTNAMCLLIGGSAVATAGLDPMQAALLMAVMIGVVQLAAGALRLGALVDYISNPVVFGYVTGAGLLIGVGQLHHLFGVNGGKGNVASKLWAVAGQLDSVHWPSVVIGCAVMVCLVAARRFAPRLPAALLVLSVATLLNWVWGDGRIAALTTPADAVPMGWPVWTVPTADWVQMQALFPAVAAGTVLSLVESSSVARVVANQTGQQLDLDREFMGQGLANVVAAFVGGFAISGSLSRTALNYQGGATSRFAGVYAGLMMLLVVCFIGPAMQFVPMPALAGLLLLVAARLIDLARIRRTLAGRKGDAMAFVATVVGTGVLPLDKAILLGVAISLGMFLRRVRFVVVREWVLDSMGMLREVRIGDEASACKVVRIIQVEGQLFFATASALESMLFDVTRNPAVRVVVLRIRRTQGIDQTAAELLSAVGTRLAGEGRHLLLVGMRERPMSFLRAAGVDTALGEGNLFPKQTAWFAAMDSALERAAELIAADGGCDVLNGYLAKKRT
jgi:SulP family sulfate permease